MNKHEIKEIKKQYGIKICGVRRIAGCYIDADKNIISKFNETFLSKPEEEQFKYLDIFKKGLSGNIGKNIRTINVSDSENITSIKALVSTGLETKSSAVIDSFFEKIIEYYEEIANCLILLMYNCYDIPGKTSDHLNTGESEDVYSYITCYFCPMKIEKAGLAYDKQQNCISEKELRWCVDAPAFSFIYPSFEDRQPDYEKITIFTKKPTDKVYDYLITSFLGGEELSVDMQKTIFNDVLSNAAEDDQVNAFEAIKKVTKSLATLVDEEGDEVIIASTDMEKILEKNSIPAENVSSIMEDKQLALKAISTNKLNLKMEGIDVKIAVDAMDRIERKTIDGKTYLTIALDDQPVNINGIEIAM